MSSDFFVFFFLCFFFFFFLDDRLPVKIAIRLSFAINIFLVGLKIFIAVRSHSMSVLASALDSVLDIVSGSIIFVIHWLTNQYVEPRYLCQRFFSSFFFFLGAQTNVS